MFSNFFLKNHTFYEIMWRNNVESDRPQMTIWCMHIASWITKGVNTHSEYLILTFPLQQWLQECTLVLRCMFIVCLVLFSQSYSN